MNNFIKNQFTNLKYWILGNIISFVICILYVIFLVKFDNAFEEFVNSIIYCILSVRFDYLDWDTSLLLMSLIPFLAGLIIKIIKKDLPIHYYGTVGSATQFLLALFIHGCTISDYMQHPYGKAPGSFKPFFFQYFFYQTIIASTLGGFIVDAYQFFKNKFEKN